MMFQKVVRVHRRDSAFLYAIFESLEGMVSFTTISDDFNQQFRDVALFIPPFFAEDIEVVLNGLRKKFPVIELERKKVSG